MKKFVIGLISVLVVVGIAFASYNFLENAKDNDNGNSTVKDENNSNTNGNASDNNATNESENNGNNSSNGSTNNKDNSVNNDNNNSNDDNTSKLKNVLVVYYSASGSTKRVAEAIASNLNADTFEIVPEDVYTSADLNWTDSNSRVTKEHNDESLRNVPLKTTKVSNWDNYDTVLIGYPIWWGIAAWPVDTFVKANDFGSKTVIPFCTSASSGLGQSGTLLANEAKGGNWQTGHRFSSGASTSDIKKWTDTLK